ncbi:hypothetical protein LXL04_036207 [Taraxacum kok-saghyz]
MAIITQDMITEFEKLMESSRNRVKTMNLKSFVKAKLWIIRATMAVLLWTCVVQLTTLGDTWGPMTLKGWPSHDSLSATAFRCQSITHCPCWIYSTQDFFVPEMIPPTVASWMNARCWFDTSSEICAVPRDYGGVAKIAKESGTNNKVKWYLTYWF